MYNIQYVEDLKKKNSNIQKILTQTARIDIFACYFSSRLTAPGFWHHNQGLKVCNSNHWRNMYLNLNSDNDLLHPGSALMNHSM